MDDVLCMNEQEYQKLDTEIKRSMKRTAAEVVRLGYFLRRMHDGKLYLVHYSDFDSYVREELCIDYSKANRFMNINKKYSFNGNSMSIDEKYEEYSQSLLEEMLNMPVELEEKVTPGMSIRQVRDIKQQAKQQEQEDTFDVDYKEIEASQDGMFATPQQRVNTRAEGELQEGIIAGTEADVGADQEELSVEIDTDELFNDPDETIDAEYREVDTAAPQGPALVKPNNEQYGYLDAFARHFINSQFNWMLEDYQNRVLDVMSSPGEIKALLPANCRHWFFQYNDGVASIDMFDDYVQLWDEKNKHMGDFEWFYLAAAIQRMWNAVALERAESERMEADTSDAMEGGHVAAPQYPEMEHSEKESAAEMQQELPALKNNDQRKQWLSEYKNWGLWYRDGNIDVNYYKFDFPDGSRLVAAEYPQRFCYWKSGRKDEHYFHLLEKNKMGYKTRYDEQYRQQTDSETYLVEFLKNIQKKGDSE